MVNVLRCVILENDTSWPRIFSVRYWYNWSKYGLYVIDIMLPLSWNMWIKSTIFALLFKTIVEITCPSLRFSTSFEDMLFKNLRVSLPFQIRTAKSLVAILGKFSPYAKDSPHPHEEDAFGLFILNPPPINLSS